MKRFVWSIGVLAAVAAFAPRPLAAQGTTSAALAGRVTDDAGTAVPAATVSLTGASTGVHYITRSANDGRYVF